MARSHSQQGSSLGSWEANQSSSRHPIGALLKCNHGRPVVYETCRKERNYGRKFFGCQLWKVNEGCGFFVWEDELEKYLFEKSTRLEERVQQLTGEMTRMQTEMARLRNGKAGNAVMDAEVNKLRGKLENQKRKRKAVEVELKDLRNEIAILKQGGAGMLGWLKFVVCVVVVAIIVVNVVG